MPGRTIGRTRTRALLRLHGAASPQHRRLRPLSLREKTGKGNMSKSTCSTRRSPSSGRKACGTTPHDRSAAIACRRFLSATGCGGRATAMCRSAVLQQKGIRGHVPGDRCAGTGARPAFPAASCCTCRTGVTTCVKSPRSEGCKLVDRRIDARMAQEDAPGARA